LDAILIAPCGINCNICKAHLRKKKQCSGCHFFAPGAARCIVRKCEERKASVSGYCYECAKFPCRRIKRIDERYRRIGISNIENLGIIKEKGVAALLKREEKKYKCPECGAVLANIGVCYQCTHGRRITRTEKMPFEKITEADLIAPCGINCGVCGGYLAIKYNLASKGIPGGCLGCIPRGRGCSLVKSGHCEKLMGMKIRFCYECEKFPCQANKRIDENYRKTHNISNIDNLKNIREHGIEKFLEKEKERWKCPKCGVVICNNGICFNCGLDKLKEFVANRCKTNA
jgi:ribosomal protein L32